MDTLYVSFHSCVPVLQTTFQRPLIGSNTLDQYRSQYQPFQTEGVLNMALSIHKLHLFSHTGPPQQSLPPLYLTDTWYRYMFNLAKKTPLVLDDYSGNRETKSWIGASLIGWNLKDWCIFPQRRLYIINTFACIICNVTFLELWWLAHLVGAQITQASTYQFDWNIY